MDKINSWDDLNKAISILESKQAEASLVLKNQFKSTYESLRPVNLLKSSLKELVTAPDFKEDLWNASISLAAGYVSKKIAIGSSSNYTKQILGSVLQMGVTSAVSHHANNIRIKVMDIVSLFFEGKAKH
jgi:hypothetical protein